MCGTSGNTGEQSAFASPTAQPSTARLGTKRLHNDADRRSSAGALQSAGGRIPGAKFGANIGARRRAPEPRLERLMRYFPLTSVSQTCRTGLDSRVPTGHRAIPRLLTEVTWLR